MRSRDGRRRPLARPGMHVEVASRSTCESAGGWQEFGSVVRCRLGGRTGCTEVVGIHRRSADVDEDRLRHRIAVDLPGVADGTVPSSGYSRGGSSIEA